MMISVAAVIQVVKDDDDDERESESGFTTLQGK